jgi:adenylyltransferase/sulfurtransferase
MQFDVWRNDWRKIKLGEPNADCKTCGQMDFEFLKAENSEFSAVLCGRNAVQISSPKPTRIDLLNLAEKLKNLGEVKQNEYLLRLTVGDFELTVFQDARAIIRGTDDVSVARSLYAKFVGV